MRISDWSSDVCSSDLWLFDVLPSDEAYCGATPTECRPFFGNAVSSITKNAASPPTRRSASASSAASNGAMSQIARKSVVSGTSVSVRVDLGGRRIIKKITTTPCHHDTQRHLELCCFYHLRHP